MAPWLQDLLGVVWVAGLALPVGLWARKRPECVLSVALLGAGLFIVPQTTELLATPPTQLLGAAFGWLLGVYAQRLGCSRSDR